MSEDVTPRKRCQVCGKLLAVGYRRATCSDRCRKAASREKRRTKADTIRQEVEREPGQMVQRTRERLEAAGRLDTPDGQMALMLAARVDSPLSRTESATGLLSLQTALTRSMDRALAGVDTSEADVLDGLKATAAATIMEACGVPADEVAKVFRHVVV